MRVVMIWCVVSVTLLLAQYHATIHPITPYTKKRMIEGNTWTQGCPVSIASLRYVEVSYWDFEGRSQQGELIVHRAVAQDIVEIFRDLYHAKYPIRKMRLVSDYKGSDYRSIEADNTSAFNCRTVAGTTKWSKHAYGRAIDINPLENPYISRTGKISHKRSLRYRTRKHHANTPEDRAMILPKDTITTLFIAHGWKWGGAWRTIKDYQHFSKK